MNALKISGGICAAVLASAVCAASSPAETIDLPSTDYGAESVLQMNDSGDYAVDVRQNGPKVIEGVAGDPFPAPHKRFAPPGVDGGWSTITPNGGHFYVGFKASTHMRRPLLSSSYAPPGQAFGPLFTVTRRVRADAYEFDVGPGGQAAIALVDASYKHVWLSRSRPDGSFMRPRLVYSQHRPGTINLNSLKVDLLGGVSLEFEDSGTACAARHSSASACKGTPSFDKIVRQNPDGHVLFPQRFANCESIFPMSESTDGSTVVALSCERKKSFVAYSYRMPNGRFSRPIRVSPDTNDFAFPLAAALPGGKMVIAWEHSFGVASDGSEGSATLQAVGGSVGGALSPVATLTAPQTWSALDGPNSPNPRLIRSGSGIPYIYWTDQTEQLWLARIRDDMTLGNPLLIAPGKTDTASIAVSAAGVGIARRSYYSNDVSGMKDQLISFVAP